MPDYNNDIAQYNPMLNYQYRQHLQQPLIPQGPQAMGPQAMPPTGGMLTTAVQKMMGQAPSQLLEKQQQFQAEQQRVMQEHQMNLLKSSYEAYNKLLDSQAVRDLAKAHDVNPSDIVAGSPLGDQLAKNALTYASMQGKSMESPAAQKAVDNNFIAGQQTTDVNNRAKLTQNVPQGGTSFVPGPNGQPGGTTVTGSLQTQGVMPDKFGMMHPFTHNTPGGVTQEFPTDPYTRAMALTQSRAGNAPGGGLPLSAQQFMGGMFAGNGQQQNTNPLGNGTPVNPSFGSASAGDEQELNTNNPTRGLLPNLQLGIGNMMMQGQKDILNPWQNFLTGSQQPVNNQNANQLLNILPPGYLYNTLMGNNR